jgi:hypothetical protein
MKISQLLEAHVKLDVDPKRIVHTEVVGPWSVGIRQHAVDQATHRGHGMTADQFLAAVRKIGSVPEVNQHAPGEFFWVHDAATNYSFLLQRRSTGGGNRITVITTFPGFPVNRSTTPTYKMS